MHFPLLLLFLSYLPLVVSCILFIPSSSYLHPLPFVFSVCTYHLIIIYQIKTCISSPY
ncbi:hypothetical protein BC941DRAFT_444755, partial [Chlamydoabsidia padenii]